MRKLHIGDVTFHGDRLRLEPPAEAPHHRNFCFVDLVDSTEEDERAVATVFLPKELRPAIVEACRAFNDVMDRHETAAKQKEAA